MERTSIQPTPIPLTPDERVSIEAVPVSCGGPSPWVRLALVGRGIEVSLACPFDVARLAGKWLLRRVIVHAYFARNVRGEIVGGYLEDLDLIDGAERSSSPGERT
jgi:hypothetical protein